MDVAELFKLLEVGLSIVGFLAVSVWLMKWAKGLHERTKELTEIDKEIRTAMRDSLAVQRELHDLEQKRLASELEAISNELEHKAGKLDKSDELLKAIASAVEIGGAKVMESKLIDSYMNESRALYEEAINLLIEDKLLTKEQYLEIVRTPPKEIPEINSSECGVKVAVKMTQILLKQSKASGAAQQSATTIPKILSYILENPDAARADIQKVFAMAMKR